MSVKVYIVDKGKEIHMGTFKDQKAAEAYWRLAGRNYKDCYGFKQPIYVDTKKRTRTHGYI